MFRKFALRILDAKVHFIHIIDIVCITERKRYKNSKIDYNTSTSVNT